MDSGVAGLAESDQVFSCVGAALGDRQLVVDLFSCNQPAFLLTQFTQRMLLYIAVTDTLPVPSVPAAHRRITVVLFVPLGLCLCVFLTEPAVCQTGTTGM